MTVSLSKITALEAAVEYLLKATAEEEQREYDPEGFHEGPRHGHYFRPGEREVGGREVEIVQAPAAESPEAKPKSEYQMPKHDFSWDTFIESEGLNEHLTYKRDVGEEQWKSQSELYYGKFSVDDNLVLAVSSLDSGMEFLGAKDEEELEEKKKAFIWNKYFYDIKRESSGHIVNAYNPPRIGEAPSWVNDTENALPDIPTDAIHIDDIPGWSKERKYGRAKEVTVGGKAGELIEDAGNVSGVLTRVFTPSILKKLNLIDELPENGDAEFEATQYGQTTRALSSLTDRGKLNIAKKFRSATQESLESRNLPEKFYVYRGGAIHKGLLTRGQEEQERISRKSKELLDITPTSVTFDVNLAAGPEYTGTAPDYYKAGVGEEEAVLTMYEVSREDVLLDIPALFHGQTEQELILLPRHLTNPRKVVLPKIPKYYPAELGEEELQRRAEASETQRKAVKEMFGLSKANELDNLSKLLVLETALDYLSKADAGKREYLAPGEKAPEGLREYPGSRPGVRYYMPGSAGAKEDEVLPDLAPGEEREIQVVSPSDVSGVGTEEETIKDPAERARTLFESISKDLEGVLSSISPDYQQFLGTPIDDSRLTADNLEHVGFTDGTFEGTTSPSGLGINSEFNFTVSIDGKPFIYKVAPGENRSEQLCYSVDRALGLNIVPYVKPYNMDIDKLHKAFKKAHRSSVVDKILLMPSEKVEIDKYTLNELESRTGGHRKYQAENQTEEQKTSLLPGGHFMEFCETCPDKEESAGIMAEMLTLKEGREEFFKLMLLDFITGNDDRHAGNWMVTKDKKAVAIDSGFAGGGGEGRSYLSIGQNARGMKLDFPWRVREALTAHIMDLGLDDNEAQDYRSHLKDRDILKSEADGVFDKYYDAEKIQKALDPLHWNSAAAARYDQQSDLKDTFREYAASYLELAMQAPYKNEGLLNTSDQVAQGLTPPKETPKFKPIEQLAWGQDKPKGLLNRFRDWVGVGAKSSNVELDPAKMTPLDRL